MSIAHILPHTVYKSVITQTPDGLGGYTKTYTDGTDPIKVRISGTDGVTQIEKAGAMEEYTHFMMSEDQFDEGDVVIWGSKRLEVIREREVTGYSTQHHYTYFLKSTRL